MMLRILVEGDKETLQFYDYNEWEDIPRVTLESIATEEADQAQHKIDVEKLEKEFAVWICDNVVQHVPEHAESAYYSWDNGGGADLYGLTEGWCAEGKNLDSYPHTYSPFYAPKPPERFDRIYSHYYTKVKEEEEE